MLLGCRNIQREFIIFFKNKLKMCIIIISSYIKANLIMDDFSFLFIKLLF
jgi:hypothetical protein